MNIEVTNLEEKERRLANYLETSTTEEVINEVQKIYPIPLYPITYILQAKSIKITSFSQKYAYLLCSSYK